MANSCPSSPFEMFNPSSPTSGYADSPLINSSNTETNTNKSFEHLTQQLMSFVSHMEQRQEKFQQQLLQLFQQQQPQRRGRKPKSKLNAVSDRLITLMTLVNKILFNY